MTDTKAAGPAFKARLQEHYRRYEKYLPAGFFLGGVVFDIFTTGRIDDWTAIISQCVYLGFCILILQQLLLEDARPKTAEGSTTKGFVSRFKSLYLRYRIGILHFCFGALLSVYTIFYFKSSSIFVSWVFIGLIIALLIANELEAFQSLGLEFKFALLALCWMSMCAFLIPTFIGRSGTIIFVGSVLIALIPIVAQAQLAARRSPDPERTKLQVILPGAIVALVFLGLYFFRLIPPVPLSAQYMGVYHRVERSPEGQFLLSHERPWWRFWHKGDQLFLAREGDQVNVFFRLFSPSNFKDQVFVNWYFKEPSGEWSLQDRIAIPIYGGRDEGYRGYAVKRNYRPGSWRATLETADEREISRIYLTIEASNEPASEWQTDIY